MNKELGREVNIALDILKKRWQLKTRVEVVQKLINEHDDTLMQLADRRARLADAQAETPLEE